MFLNQFEPIYFETRFGIHTFFVKRPIDVIVMDADFIVRDMRIGLKPFGIFVWDLNYFRVIETEHGFIKKQNIKIGQKIILK